MAAILHAGTPRASLGHHWSEGHHGGKHTTEAEEGFGDLNLRRRGTNADKVSKREDQLVEAVIGRCIAVHRELGPGEEELVYEKALSVALDQCGLAHVRQLSLPLRYRDQILDCGFRIDTLVDSTLVLELKVVEAIAPVHVAQILTYLKLSSQPLGFLINFEVPALRLGIRRFRWDAVSFSPQQSAAGFNTGDRTVDKLLASASRVHASLGPGLLRSAYQACLHYELKAQGIPLIAPFFLPVSFAGKTLDHATEVPLLVESRIPVHCFSARRVSDVQMARMRSLLRRAGWPYGFLLNFNVSDFETGIRRVTRDT